MSSGDALCVWTALSNEPPDADFATLDTILTASADEPDDIIPVSDSYLNSQRGHRPNGQPSPCPL